MMKPATISAIVVAIASLGAGLPPARAATCHTSHFNFYWGQDAQAQMSVKSGESCVIRIRTHGGGMSESSIPQQAEEGVVSSQGPYEWAYKSKAGYAGSDSFVVQMVGESMSNKFGHSESGATNLAVSVDVTR